MQVEVSLFDIKDVFNLLFMFEVISSWNISFWTINIVSFTSIEAQKNYLRKFSVNYSGTLPMFIYMKNETTRNHGMEQKFRLLLKETGLLTA